MRNEADQPVRGFFKRLRAKLNTGPAWLTTDLTELLPGRKSTPRFWTTWRRA